MSHFLITPENTKILICCHKPSILPTDDLFLPLQVGKAISHYDLHIQGDDTCRGVPCNNISNKNDSYCELTGLYWAWKNIKTLYPNIKYLGLCHYRRYFSFSRIGLFSDSVDLPVSEIKNYKIDHEKLSNILTAKAIILPTENLSLPIISWLCILACQWGLSGCWEGNTRCVSKVFFFSGSNHGKK